MAAQGEDDDGSERSRDDDSDSDDAVTDVGGVERSTASPAQFLPAAEEKPASTSGRWQRHGGERDERKR